MVNAEALMKLKELLDSGAISQEEFEEQKKSMLQSDAIIPKKKNSGLIIAVAVVAVICISIIFGDFSESSEGVVSESAEQNVTVPDVKPEVTVPVEFATQCPVSVTASMYDNIIGVTELKCTFKNSTGKEIAAIKLYFEPRDVYGENVNSIFATNQLYTDETIAANGSASRAWQLLDDEIKSGDVYVYSVYFSDGSEWGNKDASVNELKKYGYKITAKY